LKKVSDMKKFGILFVLAIAFFTFTAQNCKKRDPYVIPGTVGNPSKVGGDQGFIEGDVVLSNGTIPVKGASVRIANSLDSFKNGKVISKLTIDSGVAVFTNLLPEHSYYIGAYWEDPNSSKQNPDKYASMDTGTIVGSNSARYPNRKVLVLKKIN
jgi:hypothetical protein